MRHKTTSNDQPPTQISVFFASDALGVRQVFVWGLSSGVGGAAGAKAVRIALYNR
jgi:hypothetical protein